MANPRPTIVPIQPLQHGAALAALYEIGFRGRHSSSESVTSNGNPSWVKGNISIIDQLTTRSANGFVLQTEQGQALGAITLFSNPSRPDTGVVANLVTDPRVRRKGVGRSLLQHAISFARKNGLAYLALQVDHDNDPAIRLYESVGFDRIGEVHHLDLKSEDLHPTAPIPIREARQEDAAEVLRLSRLANPDGLTYADSFDPARYKLPLLRIFGKRSVTSRVVWRVAESSGRGLAGAVRLEPSDPVSSKAFRADIMLDPRASVGAGIGLISETLRNTKDRGDWQIYATQSGHALTTLRAMKSIGFGVMRILFHMRLRLT